MNIQTFRQANHGGRMTKWKGRTASMAPALLTVSVIALGAGMGEAQVVYDEAFTEPQTVTEDVDVTVTEDGSIAITGTTDGAALTIEVDGYTSDVVLNGPLSNTDAVTTDRAAGLRVGQALAGTVTANSTIDVSAVTNSGSLLLVGMEFGSTTESESLSGTVLNTGIITGSAVVETGSGLASALGIFVRDEDMTGTVTNTGTLDLSGSAFDGAAAAGGMAAGSLRGTALMENAGDITARASLEGGTAAAGGMISFGALEEGATLLNSGTLDISATATIGELFVGGMIAGPGGSGEVAGTVSNTGTIEVAGSLENAIFDTRIFGVRADGVLTGSVVNDGSVMLDANVGNVSDQLLVDGLSAIAGIAEGAALTNNGALDMSVDLGTSSGLTIIAGMNTFGPVEGTMENTGTMELDYGFSGAAGENLFVGGMMAGNTLLGQMSNSGTITLDATAENSAVAVSVAGLGAGYASDLTEVGDQSGTLSNSGELYVTLTGAPYDTSMPAALIGYGIATQNVTETGVVENSGVIVTTVELTQDATQTQSGSISAFGMVADTVSGRVTNSGTVTADALIDGDNRFGFVAAAAGLVTDEVTGTGVVENSGSIRAEAKTMGQAQDSYLQAETDGVTVGEILGTITNSGEIEAVAHVEGTASRSMSAEATGLRGTDIATSGTVTNSGTITALATLDGQVASDSYMGPPMYETYAISFDRALAEATGMHVGAVDGGLMNSGRVVATADATAETFFFNFENTTQTQAQARGVEMDDVSGLFDNAGSIEVSATADGSTPRGTWAEATGVLASGVTPSGAVYNDGSIDVIAAATATTPFGPIEYSAQPMSAFNEPMEPTLMIIGPIGPFGGASAQAVGLSLGKVAGVAGNDGVITVTAEAQTDPEALGGTASASATGILLSGTDDGAFMFNSGAIDVQATTIQNGPNGALDSYAAGLSAMTHNGVFLNTGTVTVSAATQATTMTNSSSDSVAAVGLNFGNVGETGVVANLGSIVVDAQNVGTGFNVDSSGIAIANLDGRLFNSGTILSTLNGDAGNAITVSDGTGVVEIETSSFFAGRLSLGNEELTVRSVEGTAPFYWTFDEIPDNVTLENEGGPQLYRSGNVVATLEPGVTSAASGMMAADVAGFGFGAVSALLSGAPAPGAIVARAQTETARLSTGGLVRDVSAAAPAPAPAAPSLCGSPMLFVQGDYVSRTIDNDDSSDLDYDIGGLTAGYLNRLDNGIGYAVSLSGFEGEGSVDTMLGEDRVESSGVVLGLYGNTALGNGVALTFGASFGRMSNEASRTVNDNLAPGGIGEIESEYDSSFVSPAVELSYATQTGNVLLRPYAGYRYTRLNVDGYEETGGATAIGYGDRDIDVSDFTIGVDASTQAGPGVLTGSLEVLRREVSEDGLEVAFVGTDATLASAATDFTAVEVGVGYGVELGTGGLDFKASGLFGNEGVSGYGVSVGYRMSF
jgi:hypothetical protein